MEKILNLFRFLHNPSTSSIASNITQDANKSFTLNVVNSNGRIAKLKVTPNSTAAEVLTSALAEFLEPDEYIRYKLWHVRSGVIIHYNTTLTLAGVTDTDEVCLIKQHKIAVKHIPSCKAPDQKTIDENTRNMPDSHEVSSISKISFIMPIDDHFYVRNFLMQMATESAYIISKGPYADFLIEYFKQKIVQRRKQRNDAIECLTNMGFEREICLYAMKLKKNIYADALHWLVDHSSDAQSYRRYKSSISVIKTIPGNYQEKFQRLVQIIRIYGCNSQRHCEKWMRALTEMGFDEEESLNTLRSCEWNPYLAVDILCGGSPFELQNSQSVIVRNVLTSSVVQEYLGDPQIFMTMIYILGSGTNGIENNWESAKVIYNRVAYVLKTYNNEKLYNIRNNFN